MRPKTVKPEMIADVLLKLILAFCLATALVRRASPQSEQSSPVPLSDAILSRVSADYRDEARKVVLSDPERSQRSELEYAQKHPDENILGNYVISCLARDSDGLLFLFGQIEKEQDAQLRLDIILSASDYYYGSAPEVQAQIKEFLENYGVSGSDADASLEAIRQLREFRRVKVAETLSKLPDNFNRIADDFDKMVGERIDMAKKAGDVAGVEKLGEQENIWDTQHAEIALPSFLREPPPVFSLKPMNQPIRVLAFGDFGTGSPEQKHLARAMIGYNKAHPFDFGLTLGDNFYSSGADSPSDPRWQTEWEQLYAPMAIKFYAVLGNHDVSQADAPAAEVLYSARSSTWRMPATYYSFTAGPVQFFAVDTNLLNDAQLAWLDGAIAHSTSRWKVVYGHHTLYSSGRETKWVVERLLPLLKNRVDLYLCGHDHNLQELRPEDGVHFFVSGGGGADLDDVNPAYGRAVFEDEANGFTVLEADNQRVKVTFVGVDGRLIYSDTINK